MFFKEGDSALAEEQIAEVILDGFQRYRYEFKQITRSAQARFENADWPGVQQASTERILLYRQAIGKIIVNLEAKLENKVPELEVWQAARSHFSELVKGRLDADLAGTVFNTVYRRIHHGQDMDDRYAFVGPAITGGESESHPPLVKTRQYGPGLDLEALLREVFNGANFQVPFKDLDQDLALISQTMRERIPLLRNPESIQLELLVPVFYRNKGAYLIGRMTIGEHLFPIAIPILNDGEGLFVDTILWNENDLSIIFSFTRSYFMVDVDSPRDMVQYLNELLPRKRAWEIYTSLGFYKHGKTEFYRSFLNHLENSDDQFVIAEGIKGMVMTVFTLPSYRMVFKVIKDKFSPTKTVTRQQVRDAYNLVKTHDRVGRMADTQEFSNFRFPRHRFSPELIAELQKVAASSVLVDDQYVTISHLYTERAMTPMNLYIVGKSEFELRMVLDEYGNAIKQLAAANIFPGDMLLKNFGVTRHGRVVFYDYDEICYLTEVNFRDIPPPRYPEDRYAAEPWYEIGPRDVFPEEFQTFLFNSPALRDLFCEYHPELFTADYWREIQANIVAEQVMDVFPYRQNRRFERT